MYEYDTGQNKPHSGSLSEFHLHIKYAQTRWFNGSYNSKSDQSRQYEWGTAVSITEGGENKKASLSPRLLTTALQQVAKWT